jgi:hydrogenase maturation protein HypF
MAVSHLVSAWDGGADLTLWAEEEGPAKVGNVVRLVRTSLHSPPTSSVGRLFDAVSSMLKIRHRVTFEGEAAMDLEMRSDPEAEGAYGFDLVGENPMVMDPGPAVRAIWRAAMDGEPVGVVGGRFHRGLAQTVGEVCARIRAQEGIERVCLSGGVFQNMLLLRLTMEVLEAGGFEVFSHRRVPTNDGGISLGQAVVAGTRAGEGQREVRG